SSGVTSSRSKLALDAGSDVLDETVAELVLPLIAREPLVRRAEGGLDLPPRVGVLFVNDLRDRRPARRADPLAGDIGGLSRDDPQHLLRGPEPSLAEVSRDPDRAPAHAVEVGPFRPRSRVHFERSLRVSHEQV